MTLANYFWTKRNYQAHLSKIYSTQEENAVEADTDANTKIDQDDGVTLN